MSQKEEIRKNARIIQIMLQFHSTYKNAYRLPILEVIIYQTGPSRFEDFIRLKLTENLTKKAPETKKRKRLSNNEGEVLTSRTTLNILKQKSEIESAKKKCKVKSTDFTNSNNNQNIKIIQTKKKNSKRKTKKYLSSFRHHQNLKANLF
jgi:hypothetical protein